MTTTACQPRTVECSFGNLNRFNRNQFRLKRLIPIEHNPRLQVRHPNHLATLVLVLVIQIEHQYLFWVYSILLGASTCIQLNQFVEAITWCDKGLAVSFTSFKKYSGIPKTASLTHPSPVGSSFFHILQIANILYILPLRMGHTSLLKSYLNGETGTWEGCINLSVYRERLK